MAVDRQVAQVNALGLKLLLRLPEFANARGLRYVTTQQAEHYLEGRHPARALRMFTRRAHDLPQQRLV